MDEKKLKRINMLSLSLGIAIMPPIWIMENLAFHPDVELYATLFVLGGLAVIIGESFSKFIFLPAWLCGWAIGLTIMGPLPVAELHSLPVQIGVAMLAGVLYVGIGVDAFQKWMVGLVTKHR